MDWDSRFAAVKFQSDETSLVHIVERRYLEKTIGSSYGKFSTFCETVVVKPYEERDEEDVNCEACVTKLEHYQEYWREFWKGSRGQEVIRILSGEEQLERERNERIRESAHRIRELEEFAKTLEKCMWHTQPVFTLELADEVLLKVVKYGSVGELLAAFTLFEDIRNELRDELGKEGFAILGSRLVTRGLLKHNDPIFAKKWE